ncbi:MAG: Fic family protein [Candidatus ainarchaeum sp.]|nr:Fic family protein [Candidatus ainarchaeum sp.]
MLDSKGVQVFKTNEGLILPTRQSLMELYRILTEYTREYVKTDVMHYGVRYEGILTMMESRLRGKRYAKAPLENALAVSEELAFRIMCEHPFTDGNKRTALIGAFFFLIMNLDYVNKNSGKRYAFLPSMGHFDVGVQMERAKQLELLAAWNDERRSAELYEFLTRNGIKVRSRNRITEDHIRQYLRKFLRELVVEA